MPSTRKRWISPLWLSVNRYLPSMLNVGWARLGQRDHEEVFILRHKIVVQVSDIFADSKHSLATG